jgi:hypothetical protein
MCGALSVIPLGLSKEAEKSNKDFSQVLQEVLIDCLGLKTQEAKQWSANIGVSCYCT